MPSAIKHCLFGPVGPSAIKHCLFSSVGPSAIKHSLFVPDGPLATSLFVCSYWPSAIKHRLGPDFLSILASVVLSV